MMNMRQSPLSEHSAYKEIKVECPKCHVTMIKVADLRSNKLLRCPVCRTPINLIWTKQIELRALHLSSYANIDSGEDDIVKAERKNSPYITE